MWILSGELRIYSTPDGLRLPANQLAGATGPARQLKNGGLAPFDYGPTRIGT
jgi:hypothetical protein